MKKHLFILTLIFCSTLHYGFSQVTFQKAFGTNLGFDNGGSLKQTNDGGFIISGSAWTNFPSTFICAYLMKTDFYGNLVWSKIFGSTVIPTTSGFDAAQTDDGGYIMASSTIIYTGNEHLILTKTNNAGDSLWCKYYRGMGAALGTCVRQTPDHGYIVGGSTGDPDIRIYNSYLMKTDSMGDMLWSKSYGGAQTDQTMYLALTADKGFILSGVTNSFNAGSMDIYIVKTDSIGDTLWTRRYGGALDDGAASIVQCNDEGYVISGYTKSFGAGGSDIYLIKIDEMGNLLWSKTFGGAGNDLGYCVKQTNDNGYIITGQSGDNELLIKTDNIGNVTWSKVLANAKGLAVETASDGGYVITGQVYKPSGDGDVLLLKTDSLGNSGCGEINVSLQTMIPATQVFSTQTLVTSISSQVFHFPTIYANWGTDTTLCTTFGLNEIKTSPSFLVSPNPSTGNFVITFPGTIKKGAVEIYNARGKKIFSETVYLTSRKEISLRNVPAGMYFVRVSGGEKRYTQKIILSQ